MSVSQLSVEKPAAFDRARAYYSFDGANWKPMWTKAPPYDKWETIGPLPINVPASVTTMQLKFEFDTVDAINNDFLGWEIDNIAIPQAGTPAPDDNVPEKIEDLTAKPGDGQVTLNWTNPGNVALTEVALRRKVKPVDENCEDAFTGHEDGDAVTCDQHPESIPTTSGATVTCTDSGLTNDTTYCYAVFSSSVVGWNDQVNPGNAAEATPTEAPPGWCEDWESGTLGNWNADGLWHVVSKDQKEEACGADCPALTEFSGNYDVWYGQDETCNYNTGAPNSGALISPEITVTPGAYTLTFDSFLSAEAIASFDTTKVYYSFNAAGPWTQLWTKAPPYNQWVDIGPLTITVPSGTTTMWLKFEFNTVDSVMDNFLGWELDNIYINPVEATSLSGAPVELVVNQVLNLPNPVKNTTTFIAQGQGISSIKVQIYNLAGQQVFDFGYVQGNNLGWHLTTDDGEIVANGVYLYIVTVRGYDSKVFRSEVKKLVVLR